MAVDFEQFLEWAKDRFGEANIKVKNTAHGTEICTHSLWSEAKIGKVDTKYHLWMNPEGGKSKEPDKGSYRCWLTDEMGSLVKLVSIVDRISYEEAEELVCGVNSLRELEKRVHEFFGYKEEVVEVPSTPIEPQKALELPDFSFLIDNLGSSHYMRRKAVAYLSARKLPTKGLYVCMGGDYKDRIVIPYYDPDGKIVFYNTRLITDKKDVLRYRKAPNEVADQEEVLFMTEWPKPGTKVYIQEGEFDAMSLQIAGLVGCACGGKYLSDTQIEMLRPYDLVLSFDADDAGMKATIEIGQKLLEKGISNLNFVRPPAEYKDWNKLLEKRGAEIVRDYIQRREKPFTSVTPTILLSNRI